MSKDSSSSIFVLSDFRPYIQAWARARGRGEFRRISLALGVHTTLVSQILNGSKCFTEEQAEKLCVYMGLGHLEADYFLKLIQIERAGTEQLKATFRRHLKQLKSQATEIKNWVAESTELTEQDRAIYYSTWQYTLVRLLTDIESYQTEEAISKRLGLSLSRVQEILRFLVSRGLCKQKGARFSRTDKNTHVEAQSPLAIRHHQNWRAKSFDLQEKMDANDLAFTAPISLSKEDIPAVKEILLKAIGDISKVVEKSDSEDVAYLGIDWLRIT